MLIVVMQKAWDVSIIFVCNVIIKSLILRFLCQNMNSAFWTDGSSLKRALLAQACKTS